MRLWKSKELFGSFWSSKTVEDAYNFLINWCQNAISKKIPQLTRVAKMLVRNVIGLVNYVNHRITNSAAEGLNAKIQQLKMVAKGFRSFDNYRLNILFHFAGLDMDPLK
ncbi:MAG: transposase [bacterium]